MPQWNCFLPQKVGDLTYINYELIFLEVRESGKDVKHSHKQVNKNKLYPQMKQIGLCGLQTAHRT